MKILPVDGDPFIRRGLQKSMVRVGDFSVETASNGLEALKKWGKIPLILF